MIENEKIISNLKKLMAFKTVSSDPDRYGGEIEAALNWVSEELAIDGLVQTRYEKDGSESLVISTDENLTPDIAIAVHIDVVSASDDLFEMKEMDGKLLGRGVADMKYALAVSMEIMRLLAESNKDKSVSLIITSDEEIGSSRGAKYLAEEVGVRPKLLIVPDGGEGWKLVERSKGALHLDVSFKGVSGHASRPWEGDSANDQMIAYINNMREEFPIVPEEDWEAETMNVGIVEGGSQGNQIADSARVLLDIRYPSKENKERVLETANSFLPRQASLRVAAEAYAAAVDINNPSVKRFIEIVERVVGKKVENVDQYGATDARFWAQYDIPCIVIEPNMGDNHMETEWADKEGILLYFQILKEFLGV